MKGLLGCSAGMVDGKNKLCELERDVPGEKPGTFRDGGEKKL